MQINKIKGTNIELTEAIQAYVEEKLMSLSKLTARFGEVAAADVEVGKRSEHHQKGPFYFCEVTMPIPGGVLRIEVEDEDLYAAIDKAKDRLKERLAEEKDSIIEGRQAKEE